MTNLFDVKETAVGGVPLRSPTPSAEAVPVQAHLFQGVNFYEGNQ